MISEKISRKNAAEFNISLATAFSAIIRDDEKTYEESIEKVNLDISCNQLFTNCSEQVKVFILSIKDDEFRVKEMQLFTNCSPKSKPLFIENYVIPALSLKLIAQTHPESPRHPRQKYYLTELGKAFKRYLIENNRKDEDL